MLRTFCALLKVSLCSICSSNLSPFPSSLLPAPSPPPSPQVDLCANLRNLLWYGDTNPDTFFPRCYCLTSEEGRDMFLGQQFNKVKYIHSIGMHEACSVSPTPNVSNPVYNGYSDRLTWTFFVATCGYRASLHSCPSRCATFPMNPYYCLHSIVPEDC